MSITPVGRLTRHDILRAAHVDDQVAANAPQAGLQVKNGLQEELSAEGSGLWVPEGRQLVLPRVKAVQRHNLHTAVKPYVVESFLAKLHRSLTKKPEPEPQSFPVSFQLA